MLTSCVVKKVFREMRPLKSSVIFWRYLSFNSSEVSRYENDGVVCLRACFDRYWLNTASKGIQKVFDNPSKWADHITSGNGLYFNDYYRWKSIDELTEFIYKSPAPGIAATFMDEEEVAFYHEHIFIKEQFNNSAAPWHHDQSYYPIDGWKNCSIWMPVTHVKAKTGLQFIKGSHKWGKWFAPRKFETAENYLAEKDAGERHYETMPEIEEGEHEILSWDMEPGDCLVFHMRAVHGGYASTSSNSRQTLVTRWLGSDATLARRPWKTSPPVIPSDITFGDLVKNSKDFPVYSASEKKFIN